MLLRRPMHPMHPAHPQAVRVQTAPLAHSALARLPPVPSRVRSSAGPIFDVDALNRFDNSRCSFSFSFFLLSSLCPVRVDACGSSSSAVVVVDRSTLVSSTDSSLSRVVPALMVVLVGGGEASESGDAEERNEPDKPRERACRGEYGGESITLARSAAYSFIRALLVCRPCARAALRPSGETLRTCAKNFIFVSHGPRTVTGEGEPDVPRTHTPHGSTPRTN